MLNSTQHEISTARKTKKKRKIRNLFLLFKLSDVVFIMLINTFKLSDVVFIMLINAFKLSDGFHHSNKCL